MRYYNQYTALVTAQPEAVANFLSELPTNPGRAMLDLKGTGVKVQEIFEDWTHDFIRRPADDTVEPQIVPADFGLTVTTCQGAPLEYRSFKPSRGGRERRERIDIGSGHVAIIGALHLDDHPAFNHRFDRSASTPLRGISLLLTRNIKTNTNELFTAEIGLMQRKSR
jgi:hypothetical protein